jgi:hypothetical protein
MLSGTMEAFTVSPSLLIAMTLSSTSLESGGDKSSEKNGREDKRKGQT